jgi:hypothetical protein
VVVAHAEHERLEAADDLEVAHRARAILGRILGRIAIDDAHVFTRMRFGRERARLVANDRLPGFRDRNADHAEQPHRLGRVRADLRGDGRFLGARRGQAVRLVVTAAQVQPLEDLGFDVDVPGEVVADVDIDRLVLLRIPTAVTGAELDVDLQVLAEDA